MTQTSTTPEVISEDEQLTILQELWSGYEGVWDYRTISAHIETTDGVVIDEPVFQAFTLSITDRSRCIQCGVAHHGEVNEGTGDGMIWERCGHQVNA